MRRLLLVGCLGILLAGSSVAKAQETALQLLAKDDLASTAKAIEQLSAEKTAEALDLLLALKNRRMKVDPDAGAVYVEVDGAWLDARSRKPTAPPKTAHAPLVNNMIRRALAPALARAQLTAEDTALRLSAAEELARSPSEDLRKDVSDALANEKVSEIRAALELALIRIDLGSSDEETQRAAVLAVGERGDISFQSELTRIAEAEDIPEATREAARDVLGKLDFKQTMIRVVGDLYYGISLGSVLMLAALGLAITFGLMGVINMAHGEMLMLGAYTTYAVQSLFVSHLPAASDWYLAAAIPTAFLFCTLVGVGLERSVLRFLYGRPLETLLATWGISLALIQTVRLVFGAQNVAVATPEWLTGGYEIMQGVVLPYNRIAIVIFTIIVVAFVWWILNKTRLGLNVRAVTQNRPMAASMGIRTAHVDMWTFGLGSGVAGLGGVALSQIGNVGPELGQGYIVDSFMVVVLGGVGKLAGTVAGALGIGVTNKLLEPVSGAVFGKIMVLVIVILFIQKRPQGLFALKGRAAEG